jgi:two-component system, OmpR family, KDP operon response regulator KdpE
MNARPTRVLLIEDDSQIRRFLRMTLEGEGIAALEAESGREGLEEAARQQPDLVILDLGLPDMDGVAVIRQLRSWSAVPVVVLSARSAEAQKVMALDSGADDYLTKPFGNLELMARLRVHLRKRAAAPSGDAQPVFRSGDVSVDLVQRQVSRAGVPVHLTPTEYDLLCVLVRSAGKVLTHSHLLKEVWGGGHAERSHYLRIYMGHLRQKLEADPARPSFILTETGVGYRLVER